MVIWDRYVAHSRGELVGTTRREFSLIPSFAADLLVLPLGVVGFGGSLLRDRAGFLFDAARVRIAGPWVDWTIVAFPLERGLLPPIESARGLAAGDVDDSGELSARTFWVLFSSGRPSSD
jgi:hypothetical protein